MAEDWRGKTIRMRRVTPGEDLENLRRALAEGRYTVIFSDGVYTPPAKPWWLCPNDPPCIHGAALHDVEDFGDPLPRCCSEGCPCGAQAKREEGTDG